MNCLTTITRCRTDMSSVIANHTHFVLSAVVARKAAMAMPFSLFRYDIMFLPATIDTGHSLQS